MNKLKSREAIELLERCPLGMLLISADHRLLGCNKAFTALTGVQSTDLANETCPDVLAPLLGQQTQVNWVMPDGEECVLSIESIAPGDSGVTARCFVDVTQAHRLKSERDALAAEVSQLSLNDERNISLLNRHGVVVSLAPLVARARRYNSPLAIVTIGIETGADRDAALHRMALLLKDQTRWADLIGCDKQGNFILVLQEATCDSAQQLVEKLAAKLNVANENAADPVHASYGLAQCNKTDDADSLLERAEAALVEAQTSAEHSSVAR